ncbi:MAG: sugar ABC transporter substrate-binding protein [Chloroflexi bacterium]|nr:sugar ABC transporter substrate-binding protein [Chloroflexota bacterium]
MTFLTGSTVARAAISRRATLRAAAILCFTTASATVLAACGGSSGKTSSTTAAQSSTAISGGTTTTGARTTGAATAKSSTSVPINRNGAKLQILVGIDTAGFKLADQVAAAWKTKHPDISVSWVYDPAADDPNKILTMFAGGVPPDVFAIFPAPLVVFASKGVLQPLDPLVKQDKTDLSDFWPASITMFTWKGTLYGLPRGFANNPGYANLDAFKELGIPPPPTDFKDTTWTFDHITQVGKQLTKTANGRTTRFGTSIQTDLRDSWGPIVWSNGGEWFNTDMTACTVTETPAVEALQWLQDLIVKYKVAPRPDQVSELGGSLNMFTASQIGFYTYSGAWLRQTRVAKFNWDYSVTPRGAKGTVVGGGGVAWSIAKATKDLGDAWLLLQHVASAQTQKTLATVFYPGRRSAAEYLAALDPSLPPKHRQLLIDAMDYVRTDPVHPRWSEINTVITNQLSYLWDGSRPAKEVATQIKSGVDPILQGKV